MVKKGDPIAQQIALQKSRGGTYGEEVTDHVHVQVHKPGNNGPKLDPNTITWET